MGGITALKQRTNQGYRWRMQRKEKDLWFPDVEYQGAHNVNPTIRRDKQIPPTRQSHLSASSISTQRTKTCSPATIPLTHL